MPVNPYLRAYMAGLVAPSIVICIAGLTVAALFRKIPPEIARAMIFPMAINPAIWGIWNVLYLRLGDRRRLTIAWHGAILPLLLIPMGIALARALAMPFVTVEGAAIITLPTIAAYYAIWKYIVGPLNDLLHISRDSDVAGRRT